MKSKTLIAFGILLSLGLTTCFANEAGHAEIQKIVKQHSVFQNIPITAVVTSSVM